MAGDPAGGAILGGSNYPSPTGGATLGSSPGGGVTLGGPHKSQQTPAAAPKIKKPSEVTGNTADDHPNTIYACEGPINNQQSGAVGAAAGVMTGTLLSEFGGDLPVPRKRSDSEKYGVTTVGGAAGYAIGSSDWFKCYLNNGYNLFAHPGATQTIDKDGDASGLERE